MNQQVRQPSRNVVVMTPFNPLERMLLVILIAAFVLLFWPSLSSMAGIWWRSDTYAHGMLVPLISVWLIWRDKHLLQNIPISSSWLAVAALVMGSVVWLIGIAVDITVLHQLAAVGLLIALVPALLGVRLAVVLSFPLLYLLFMVPFGEELTPVLQQITADITVQALRMSGIPVYINGLFIEIPTGRFEVAEACSGIRYLIASLALGTLYAYLTYQKPSKRILFIIAALLVPILANGLRAYGIVLIAHLSEMKYATGVDHLIYGWLFFGLVMALMFWIGSYWRDPEPAVDTQPAASSTRTTASLAPAGRLPILLSTLALFALIGVATAQLNHPGVKPALGNYQLQLNDWQADEITSSDWRPDFIGADRTLLQHFRHVGQANTGQAKTEQSIGLYIGDYQSEAQDKELINQMNRINSAENWSLSSQTEMTVSVGALQLPVKVSELRHIDGDKRQVWHWYQAYQQFASSGIKIKLWQALNRLSGSPYPSSVYAIAVDYQDDQQPEQLLTQFMSDNWTQILDQRAMQLGTDRLQEQP